MIPKHFKSCPMLNKYRKNDEADDTNGEDEDGDDDDDDDCALHVKLLDF